jgi:predicted metal-dependent hydrolase
MKKNIKKLKRIYSIFSVSFVALSLFGANKIIQRLHEKDTTIVTEETAIPQRVDYKAYLQQEEDKVWQKLETINISKEAVENLKKTSYQNYLNDNSTYKDNNQPVSKEYETMVHKILREFGIDPATITLGYWDGPSEACAGDFFMKINPVLMPKVSPETQTFMIAHEVQHILNKDHSTTYFIRNLLENPVSNSELTPDHPLMHFILFAEKRADMQAAMKSPEWAKRYLCFAQEISQLGDIDPNDTAHPGTAERVKIAQALVENSKQQIV